LFCVYLPQSNAGQVEECGSVLWYVAVCCSMLQCVLQCVALFCVCLPHYNADQVEGAAVRGSVLQSVVWQCGVVAECILQV